MTSAETQDAQAVPPPPPPPAEITYAGEYSVNPLGEVSFRKLCAQLPSVLRRIARMSWDIDRRAVLLLLVCQLATGVAAAVLLTATAKAMRPILGGGAVSDRLHQALPALLVVAGATALTRGAGALATYAERRITPKLTTVTDTALVEAVCRVEASAYAVDGFADRQEAAEMGVLRTHVMVIDAQRFMSALVRMVTASGVLSVLNPLMLPLLLLAVLPAGVGAVLTARVDYEIHYANIADRNVRGMMRWWSTTPKYADEVRANGMTDYLLYWYRSLSERVDERTLAAAPRTLRIALVSSLVGGVFLVATWVALAWLAVTGRVALAIAATAVVAVQATLAALSQVIINGAAVFHTSLYLSDMQAFLDDADERAPKRGKLAVSAPVEEIRLEEVTYQYPGKDKPAVDGVSLTLRRGEILAIVGVNGSGKSTLTRLITGIYLTDKGRVTWNSDDLASVDPATVWACTGLVPQIFAQWPLRVRENVTLGQPRTLDDGPVWEAVDAVGMREAVEDLSNGLDTLLAREVFGGAELSGGQWQRLACSRALYRRPPLLILDEPTSQMDPRGEHQIFEEIKAIAGDRITIVVTHRLENTKVADHIVVMEQGRITEQGRYDDLVHAGGTFAELLELSQDR
ncbi:ATP-binding cassette domain-containing protein [Streptomyces lunaelactis]|uniref:ATP-binding cassette domain-containing protein n=1 Tax=Streptomyces lunaelactis TaxID=1535768 RepID=UPI001585824B|nr:ATP-binding cassette domain-containing protein [Streptomyces lunaelactis]NUK02041.1 ATP-binding cassette domain-containing protein [Streptomyces lunaelactis]NUK23819.1 ATP-binding cassette domain-containing protein [Streptomyces lunaelactis]NUK50552.1 ATP-binding cassette domain-containing protein [Streptomyces lunaelactis]NUK63143.1 ATP-binding cassette domain-containing protein [Streptomyces lunaelactis]NUK72858.1 ATP-binding cassette domain-containing protein [Streptomyces lunaelactis]